MSSIAARRRNSLCIAVVCSAIVSLLSSVNYASVVVAVVVVVGVRSDENNGLFAYLNLVKFGVGVLPFSHPICCSKQGSEAPAYKNAAGY